MKQKFESVMRYQDLLPIIKEYFRDVESESISFLAYDKMEDWKASIETGISYKCFALDTNYEDEFAIERQDILEILRWYLGEQNKELLDVDFRVDELAYRFRTKFKLNQRR